MHTNKVSFLGFLSILLFSTIFPITLEMPECTEMNQIQCNGNIDCNWVEDIETGSCSSLYSDECDSTPGCSWDYDCIQWGWWYNWCYEYGYECNGGTYEIDNGYCEEVELPDCSDLDQNLCNHPAYGEGCEWVENIEYGDCDDVTNGSECYAIEECSWYSGGSYGYGFDGCYGGIYEIDNGYCEETVEYLMGDINGDSVVNILDVIETVNLILNGTYNYIVDMDNDSDVNVIDIIQMINIILNQIAE